MPQVREMAAQVQQVRDFARGDDDVGVDFGVSLASALMDTPLQAFSFAGEPEPEASATCARPPATAPLPLPPLIGSLGRH